MKLSATLLFTSALICAGIPAIEASGQRTVSLHVTAEVQPSCSIDVNGGRVTLACGEEALRSVRVSMIGPVAFAIPDESGLIAVDF